MNFPLEPSRLAVFVSHAGSGLPFARLPVYAEVVWTVAEAVPRFDDEESVFVSRAVGSALSDIDNDCHKEENCRERIEVALSALVARLFDDGGRTSFLQDFGAAVDLLQAAIGRALEIMGANSFAGIATPDAEAALQAALREEAGRRGLSLRQQRSEQAARTAYPLGVLASDHVGYLSWDLTRLPTAVRDAVNGRIQGLVGAENDDNASPEASIWIYPMGLPLLRQDVLEQRRFAADAVLFRLEADFPPLPPAVANLGVRALQNPGLADWRLSPGSFAAVPQALIGSDGCETLTPANFATSQFHMRQVVRLNQNVEGTTHPECYVNEYTVSLIPIGHSLGQLRYSLPLAPGESVRLAVVDWRRQDAAQRDQKTVVTEALVHGQTRDRTVSETVAAALSEWQRGGSVMGGLAAGGGASGPMGLLEVAGGGMLSVGAGYATSKGNRDLAGETVQKVTDAIHQASSSVRELQSTVVVQTDQHESENIMTRAFANYNRAHTMTILYYEVLQHYRVVTEYTRRTRAVLLPGMNWDLGNELVLLNHRNVLEPELLDITLKPAFEALLRADKVRKDRARNPRLSIQHPGEKDTEFTHFLCHFYVGDEESVVALSMTLILKNGTAIKLLHGGDENWNRAEQFNQERTEFTIEAIPEAGAGTIRWNDIDKFRFFQTSGGDDLRVVTVNIEGVGPAGRRWLHQHIPGTVYLYDHNGASHFFLSQNPPPPPPKIVAPTLPQELDLKDYALVERLKEHVQANDAHYRRLLDLARHPNSYALRFENEAWSESARVIDAVWPTPLEIMGSRVAFPLLDDKPLTKLELAKLELDTSPVERLISLPTRGVFAEAKLGHCNVAEEIDESETRFWRWNDNPLPFAASDIAPVQPIQPTPQTPNLGPTSLPSPVAVIQAPLPVPDPTGMAAILKTLSTPDVFRDMSAKAEVQKLLEDLVEGAVDMAGAANRAREIRAKHGTDLDKQQKNYDLGVYQADAELAGKSIEADARHAEAQVAKAQAEASRAEADAKKANTEAAVQQAEAAKHLPKSMRQAVHEAAANTLAGNPVKEKVVIFKAIGFDGQTIDGWFGLAVRDVRGQQDVIAEAKVRAYFDRPITFKTADPVIEARASRKDTVPIKLLDKIIYLPGIDALSPRDSYTVGRSHNIINVTLMQASREVQFKATSTDAAVDELMSKWGGEFGVDKVVALKVIAEYEKKNSITHGNAKETNYTVKVPTQNYELLVTSKT